MGTELTPSGRTLSLDMEFEGRPRDNGLYIQDSSQIYNYGKRILTFDGKVYKYVHAKTAFYPGFLTWNAFTAAKHIGYAVLPTAIIAGDRFAHVTVAATVGDANVGFSKDELIGGTIVVGHNNAQTGYTECRTITANDAVGAAGGTMRVWVDGPFGIAHATSDGAEAYPNIYAYTSGYPSNSADLVGYTGVATAKTTILYNSFIQTWGLCWVNPGGTSAAAIGEAAGDRRVFAIGDGSISDYTALTTGSYGRQIIGYMADTTAAATSAMPLVYLQIST